VPDACDHEGMRPARSLQDSLCTWIVAASLVALTTGCGAPPGGSAEPRSPDSQEPGASPATRPQSIRNGLMSGFVMPREAIDAGVQGTIIVKCVITIQGRLTNCRVIKSLPFLDKVVVEWFETMQVKPITRNGKPVEVEYTIPLKIKLDLPAPSPSAAPSSERPPTPSTESSSSAPTAEP